MKRNIVKILMMAVVLLSASVIMNQVLYAERIRVYTTPNPGVPDPNTGIVLDAPIEVAKEYEKLNPGVKIEFIIHPWTSEQDMRLWHVTQLVGGTPPDLYHTQPNWVREDLGKGWWISVDPLLAQPNPYVKIYKTWEDLFLPGVLDIWKLLDGKRYTIQITQQQVVFYYNKDIFKKVGVTEPETWRQFMSVCDKLKTAGYTPLAWNLGDLNQLTWTSGWFTNFLFYDRWQEWNLNGDGQISDWELATAIKEGKISATMPEYKDALRLMSEMSQYWSEGSIGTTRPANYRLFVVGEAAIFLDGTWNLFGLENDPLREFEYGMFYYPRLTPKDSRFITSYNVPMNNKAAGYGDGWSIPTVTKKRGTFDAAVDFWRYYTVPENMTKVTEQLYTLPNVKGATGNPLANPVIPSLGYPVYIFEEEDVWLTIEYGTYYLQLWQDIYIGHITTDQAAEEMQKHLMNAAEKVLEIRKKVIGEG